MLSHLSPRKQANSTEAIPYQQAATMAVVYHHIAACERHGAAKACNADTDHTEITKKAKVQSLHRVYLQNMIGMYGLRKCSSSNKCIHQHALLVMIG